MKWLIRAWWMGGRTIRRKGKMIHLRGNGDGSCVGGAEILRERKGLRLCVYVE